MKDRDIKGDNPSKISDQLTAKIAKEWKWPALKSFNDTRTEIMRSKWFRVEASEDEKKGILQGFKMGWNCKVGDEKRISSEYERVMEWRARTKADDSLLSEDFKKVFLKK